MTTAVASRPRTSDQGGADHRPPVAGVFVIFGITGDLAKVMTFHSLYRLEQRGLLTCPIVGVAVDDWSPEDLRRHAHDAIVACAETIDDAVFARLTARMSYVSGDFGDAATFQRLKPSLGDVRSPVFYLELPPVLFGPVIRGLSEAGLTQGARVVVEKPFGHDLVGDSKRFTRQDVVEQCWRVMAPLLDDPPPHPPVREGDRGTGGRQRDAGRLWHLARAVDGVMSAGDAETADVA